jgi:hypothetical protein
MSKSDKTKSKPLKKLHVFIDEAGDTTFFGKGKENIVGQNGVSKTFCLGMVQIKEDFDELREKISKKALEIENSSYYSKVASVKMRIKKYGKFVFHAKDDLPEIRKEFYDFILKQNFSLQVVVGRKIMSLYIKKHNSNSNEFYADLLSHLIKDKFNNHKIVLNIAERESSTSAVNLRKAQAKAEERAKKSSKFSQNEIQGKIAFNVQSYSTDPILCLADYSLWAVQRILEKGETRFYDYIFDKIVLVVDLYDYQDKTKPKWYNYYHKDNPLTENNQIKISPSNG